MKREYALIAKAEELAQCDEDNLNHIYLIDKSGAKFLLYVGDKVYSRECFDKKTCLSKILEKYPVLEKVTKGSIESAVAILYGPGLNKEGNTVIVGHNYRNGQFFSNNKKLANGDKVYITDTDGNKLSYTIYNKFETTAEDTTFYTRNTNGAREITLSTCTDDSKRRIIIFAKADDDA